MSAVSELRHVYDGWVDELCCQVTLGQPVSHLENFEEDKPPLVYVGVVDPSPPSPGKDICAVFDTGATGSSVSRRLARAIGLRYITSESVLTSDGEVESAVYYASLWLPNNIVVPFMRILDMQNDRDDLLIGMDIICQSKFLIEYDPENHKTIFDFSSSYYPPGQKPDVSKVRRQRDAAL